MLELYYFHGATCGLKARLTLAEKGVGYTGHAVDRAYLRTPEYLKLNRNGVVPTLVHDDEVLTESSVIINYVDDAFDGPPLKPSDPRGIAGTWWWMKRADECLFCIGTLTYTVSLRPIVLEKSPEELERYIEETPNPALRLRRRRLVELGYDNPDFPAALEGLTIMLSDMEEALTGHEWLASDEYSLADTAMSPLIERLDELQCAGLWTRKHPHVTAWWQKIKGRDSYDACLAETPNPEKPQHARSGRKAWPEIERRLAG